MKRCGTNGSGARKLTSQLAILNQLVNDPTILEHVAPGHYAIDMAGFFRPGNVMLGDQHGAALFGMISPGVYEGHYLLKPGQIGLARQFISQLFTEHYADAIVGHIPVNHRAARAMTRALGFTRQGTSVSPSGRSCVDYVLERHTWEKLSAE